MAGRITYLGEADKAAIYEAALEIMETVGQRVHHAEALALLRAAGCTVTDPDLVCIPRGLVEQARATAPHMIEFYDRRGEPAMSLGGYNAYFGNGSAVASVYGGDPGEHRPPVLSAGVAAARLCDALPMIDFVMAYAHPGGVDPHIALLESFRAMVANTTKPLVVVGENAGDLEVMWRIAGVRGHHHERLGRVRHHGAEALEKGDVRVGPAGVRVGHHEVDHGQRVAEAGGGGAVREHRRALLAGVHVVDAGPVSYTHLRAHE